ncbi:MAG TPA: hypothetical protein VNA89_12425, partial [Gemmatimonadaceae bacterium]|nr:hypothetical protein [Gemmatimonadaceae bacterium]
ESIEGGERRRLATYPTNWASLPPVHLRVLLARAASTGRRPSGESGGPDEPPRPDPDPPRDPRH